MIKLTWANFKKSPLYFITRPLTMFVFEEKKNGIYSFSTKKFWAFVLLSFALYDHASLQFGALDHWTVALTAKKVSSTIVTAIMVSRDALSAFALKVYLDGKKGNAA